MNKIYRLITSRVTGIVRVAPETARAQGKGKRLLMAAPLAAVLASAGAYAADWNAPTGDWFTPGNWSTNAVPSAANQVTINNGGTAQVQSAAAAAGATYVGTTGSGTLAISGGGVLNGAYSYIGKNAGGSGAVTVEGAGSSWSSGSHLYVGEYGSGTLSISHGGTLSSAQSLIGYRAGSSGAVTVDGAGSSWSKSGGYLYLGFHGSGTLAIGNGGAVSSLTSFIGFEAGGSGAVTVDGAGSSWSNSGDLYVGIHGSGSLDIRNGGAVSDRSGHIGSSSGDGSTVTVDGAGSSWSNSDDLYVGMSGSGTLSISHGGAVSDRSGLIGYNAGSSGTVTVDGAGSSWSNSVALYVGYSGSGTLDIRNGGAVSNTYGFLRRGAVTVDGADSSWSNSGALYLGQSGSGTLVIRNGGAGSNTTGYIGLYGGSGAVTVDGAGSRWSNSGNLYVGESDSGTLSISNGGVVNVGGGTGTLTLARYSGSNGTLDIGAGGAAGMLNAAAVYGGAGTATLNFNHSDSAYHFTRDGSASGTAIAIGGSTSVNHVGSGTTVLAGVHTYSGATNINGGTLIVNGSIAGATFVNSGGTLGGSGTLGDVTVKSGGTLSPGNSPGILSINGDLTLNAGSTTVMQIDGMTQGAEYDHIDVSGTATLAGTLDLQFSFVPTSGSIFNLIEAGSLVLAGDPQTGFNPITDNLSSNLGAALRVMPLVDAGSFDILIQQLSFIEASGGNLASNQRSVAANLDSFSTSGRGAALFGELNLLSAGALPGAFDSLSGAQHAHTRPLIAQASRQFMRVLGDRLNWEAPASNAAANRFGNIKLAYNGGDIASLFGAPVSGKPASNLWLRAMGGFGDIDGDGNAAGADYNSSGMALGYDREVRDGLLAGVAFGFARSDVGVAAGNTGIDSYQLAAYGRQQWADNYLAASLGIGRHRADSTRQIRFGGFSEVARAAYATDGLGLALEAGRHYAWSAAGWGTPLGGRGYGHFRPHR